MGAAGSAAGLAGAAGSLGMAGTALTAGSAIFGGISAMNAANYQSAVASNNAKIMALSKDQALIAGQNEESRQKMKTSQLVAEQKATQGASGIDVAVGSPVDVRESTQAQGDLDAQTIRYNYARQAYSYGTEAQNYQNEATMQKAAGKDALLGGILKGGASFVGGASSIANNKLKFQDVGITS
jgi:hypothetical protein